MYTYFLYPSSVLIGQKEMTGSRVATLLQEVFSVLWRSKDLKRGSNALCTPDTIAAVCPGAVLSVVVQLAIQK
jgi:hypothetical protein